jgi:hypothetical protein
MKLLSEISEMRARLRENTLSGGAGVALEKTPSGTRISLKQQELPGGGVLASPAADGPKGQWDTRLYQNDSGNWVVDVFDSLNPEATAGDLRLSNWVKVPYISGLRLSGLTVYVGLVSPFSSYVDAAVTMARTPLDSDTQWFYPLAMVVPEGSSYRLFKLHIAGNPVKVLGRWV